MSTPAHLWLEDENGSPIVGSCLMPLRLGSILIYQTVTSLTYVFVPLACGPLHWLNDNFIDRIYFTCCALAAIVTLLNIHHGSAPYNIVKSLLLLMALRILQIFLSRLVIRLRMRKALKVSWGVKG